MKTLLCSACASQKMLRWCDEHRSALVELEGLMQGIADTPLDPGHALSPVAVARRVVVKRPGERNLMTLLQVAAEGGALQWNAARVDVLQQMHDLLCVIADYQLTVHRPPAHEMRERARRLVGRDRPTTQATPSLMEMLLDASGSQERVQALSQA